MSNRQPQYRYWQTTSDRQWRWALVAANNETVSSGEGYRTRGGVLRGIEAHRRAAANAVVLQADHAPSRAVK